jgi:hypothetical protein
LFRPEHPLLALGFLNNFPEQASHVINKWIHQTLHPIKTNLFPLSPVVDCPEKGIRFEWYINRRSPFYLCYSSPTTLKSNQQSTIRDQPLLYIPLHNNLTTQPATMDQFPHFRKLPQEIQNNIWARTIPHPTPCVQAVAVCGFKDGSEEVNTQPFHMVRQANRLRMLLPDPVLTRRSPYYYILAQAAPVCRASYEALVRAQQERGGTQITAVGPHPYAALTLSIGEKKTMGWTIVAAKGRLTEEDKTLGHDGDHVPDPIIASRDPGNNIFIFTNPTVDILLMDFPHPESSWLAGTLVTPGFYEPNLIQL